MANKIGDLQSADLIRIVEDLRARLAMVEMKLGIRAMTLVSDGVTLGQTSTSYVRMAWTSFLRSGSKVTVDVHVTLAGAASMDVQLRADGVQIDAKNVTASGTITLSGFLQDTWAFGERKELDVQGKLNTPTGSASGKIAVLGAAQR